MSLWQIHQDLSLELSSLSFEQPVALVYNPLEYAAEPARRYFDRFGRGPKEVVLLGMNPGPWGMVQTGVPFGEVGFARDWLGIEGVVEKPPHEHPKRPIEGFDCQRSEVSGRRLWGWARDTFGDPESFFSRFFVGNYCPLAFLEASGRNRTPDKLPAAERESLFRLCDHALRRWIEVLDPRWVVGIGKFAETRARSALGDLPISIGTILHPSPASPAANRGWVEAVERQFFGLGIDL